MRLDERNSLHRFIMSRRTEKFGGLTPSLQQQVCHFDVWWHFSQIHAYFENYLVLELKHHSLQTHSVSSSCMEDEKLWKSFSYVSGMCVCLRGESRQTNREDRLQRTVNYLIRRIVSLNKSKKLDQGLSLFEKSQAAEP